jgi:hypothetical protein
MITMMMALSLAMQDQAYGAQDQADQQIEQRALQEMQGGMPQMPQQMPEQPAEPSKHQVRDMAKGLERMGDMYEVMGRCAGSMTPSGVESTLRAAQASPAAAYLLGRYERGFRKPKGDAWCEKNLNSMGG